MSSTTPITRPAWEEARLRNAQQSALHRLPTEILLQIMDLLFNPEHPSSYIRGAFPEAKADLFFFRHVCHRFAHLYAHPRYDGQRKLNRVHVVQGPLPGYGLDRAYQSSAQDHFHDLPLRRRLHASSRDRCATCTAYRADVAAFAARVANLQHPLSCRGCSWHHPAIAFPPNRRAKKSASRRLCIARTGRIRLCMHVSFSSSTVHNWMHPYEDIEGVHHPIDLEARDDRTEFGWPMETCKDCFKDKQQLRGPELRLPTVYVDQGHSAKMLMRWTCPVAQVDPADHDGIPTDKIIQKLAWMDAKPEYRCLIGEQSSYTSRRVVQAIRDMRPGQDMCRLGFGPSDPRMLRLRLNEAKDMYFLECITTVDLSGNNSPQSIDDCTDFVPLMSMQSVNLFKDDETRHVTWCPDLSCRTGKGFDAHLLTVKHWDQCAREGKQLTSQWQGPAPRWRAFMGACRYRAIMRKPADGVPYVPYSVQMARLEPPKESWIMGKLRGVLKR